MRAAKENGMRLGFVTTTSPDNIAALLSALAPEITADTFDIVVDSSSVSASKPDPLAYQHALKDLGEDADHSIAIEDNEGGVHAAIGAGLTCIAFPNQNTVEADFSGAAATVEALNPDDVLASIKA